MSGGGESYRVTGIQAVVGAVMPGLGVDADGGSGVVTVGGGVGGSTEMETLT